MKSRKQLFVLSLMVVTLLLTFNINASTPSPSTIVPVGNGGYTDSFPTGVDAAILDNIDVRNSFFTTSRVTGPIPTNDWWSELVWSGSNTLWQSIGSRGDGHVQYPHPYSIALENRGVRIQYKHKENAFIAQNATGVRMAYAMTMDHPYTQWNGGTEYDRPSTHMNMNLDFVVGNSQSMNMEAYLDGYSDWFVTAQYDDKMKLTYGHGSPYVWFEYSSGSPVIYFEDDAMPIYKSGYGNSSSNVLVFSIVDQSAEIESQEKKARDYALFAPSGATWSGLGTNSVTCNLPSGKDYLVVAILSDNSISTINKLQQYAYTKVTNTVVDWSYNDQTQELLTSYQLTTTTLEGSETDTLIALYPHQWRNTSETFESITYDSPRGLMKVVTGNSFSTSMTFNGILGMYPPLANNTVLESYVEDVVSEVNNGTFAKQDSYYEGKHLGKLAQVLPMAEQVGNNDYAKVIEQDLSTRIQNWLDPFYDDGSAYTRKIFYYNQQWGTMIGYDCSFNYSLGFEGNQLNDHHFHYGYFIKAAAELVRRDKEWLENWGGMIELLIRDIAAWDRDDPMFPFLRNFDIYAGHSWASGHALFGAGNNNESAGEAINAWTGLILWGEYTGNTTIRELGIYLYLHEIEAAKEYWYDVNEENHITSVTYPGDSQPTQGLETTMISMNWGGKNGHETWFGASSEECQGIILMPISPGSMYLTHNPDYVETNFNYLYSTTGNGSYTQWGNLFHMYEAIVDPASAGSRSISSTYSADNKNQTENGNSAANTYQWIQTLANLGNIDTSVTADTPLYSVFNKYGTKHYAAYNPTDAFKTVTFSDGKVMLVGPNTLGFENAGGAALSPTPTPSPTPANWTGYAEFNGSATDTVNTENYTGSVIIQGDFITWTITPDNSANYILIECLESFTGRQHMTHDGNGNWTYTSAALHEYGEVINYDFGINISGPELSSVSHNWIVGEGSGPTPTSTTAPTYTPTPTVNPNATNTPTPSPTPTATPAPDGSELFGPNGSIMITNQVNQSLTIAYTPGEAITQAKVYISVGNNPGGLAHANMAMTNNSGIYSITLNHNSWIENAAIRVCVEVIGHSLFSPPNVAPQGSVSSISSWSSFNYSSQPVSTPTNTPTQGPTSIPTNTPIPTSTSTPLPTSTPTPIPTTTNTPLPTATNTPVPTSTPMPTPAAGSDTLTGPNGTVTISNKSGNSFTVSIITGGNPSYVKLYLSEGNGAGLVLASQNMVNNSGTYTYAHSHPTFSSGATIKVGILVNDGGEYVAPQGTLGSVNSWASFTY